MAASKNPDHPHFNREWSGLIAGCYYGVIIRGAGRLEACPQKILQREVTAELVAWRLRPGHPPVVAARPASAGPRNV